MAAHIIEIMPRKFKIERVGICGDLALFIDDFQFMTLHYDHRYTSNASQWSLLERLARESMIPGETLEIHGKIERKP